MSELIMGPTGIIQWIYSGGTISLAADYRTCDWNPTTAYADASAGADSQVGRLPTLKDATMSITLVGQTAGTQLAAALAPQTAGTLIVGPEGTAVGKRKITLPGYSDGAKFSFPYADVATVSVQISGSSTLANYTDATY